MSKIVKGGRPRPETQLQARLKAFKPARGLTAPGSQNKRKSYPR